MNTIKVVCKKWQVISIDTPEHHFSNTNSIMIISLFYFNKKIKLESIKTF